MDCIVVNGKPEYYMNDYDFADLLSREFSHDAGLHFIDVLESVHDKACELITDNPSRYCSGECDMMNAQIDRYESILSDIRNLSYSIYKTMTAGPVSSRRTEDEQATLETAMKIMSLSAQDFKSKQSRKIQR